MGTVDHARPVNLHRLVRDVVAAMEERLRGIEVVLVLDEQPLFVTVNQRKIEHLLGVLLGKAADTSARKILVAVHAQEDRRARVEVSDSGGSGIAPDVAELQEIVDSYGGILRTTSTTGIGNEFIFDLPLSGPR